MKTALILLFFLLMTLADAAGQAARPIYLRYAGDDGRNLSNVVVPNAATNNYQGIVNALGYQPATNGPIPLPFVTISSKGVANGLSIITNDGFHFGPDSLKADLSPTDTGGWQEAIDSLPRGSNKNEPGGGTIFVGPGVHYTHDTIYVPSINNSNPFCITIRGPGMTAAGITYIGDEPKDVMVVGYPHSLTGTLFQFYNMWISSKYNSTNRLIYLRGHDGPGLHLSGGIGKGEIDGCWFAWWGTMTNSLPSMTPSYFNSGEITNYNLIPIDVDCNWNNYIIINNNEFAQCGPLAIAADHIVLSYNLFGGQANSPNDWPTNHIFSSKAAVVFKEPTGGLWNGNKDWIIFGNTFINTPLIYYVEDGFNGPHESYHDQWEGTIAACATTGSKWSFVEPRRWEPISFFYVTNTANYTLWNVNPTTNHFFINRSANGTNTLSGRTITDTMLVRTHLEANSYDAVGASNVVPYLNLRQYVQKYGGGDDDVADNRTALLRLLTDAAAINAKAVIPRPRVRWYVSSGIEISGSLKLEVEGVAALNTIPSIRFGGNGDFLTITNDGYGLSIEGLSVAGAGRNVSTNCLRWTASGTSANQVTLRQLYITGFECPVAFTNVGNVTVERYAGYDNKFGLKIFGAPAFSIKVDGANVGPETTHLPYFFGGSQATLIGLEANTTNTALKIVGGQRTVLINPNFEHASAVGPNGTIDLTDATGVTRVIGGRFGGNNGYSAVLGNAGELILDDAAVLGFVTQYGQNIHYKTAGGSIFSTRIRNGESGMVTNTANNSVYALTVIPIGSSGNTASLIATPNATNMFGRMFFVESDNGGYTELRIFVKTNLTVSGGNPGTNWYYPVDLMDYNHFVRRFGQVRMGGVTNRINSTATASIAVSGTLKADISTVGNVGTGEDTLITYTVPAGTGGLSAANGTSIEATMFGTFAANGNNKTLKLKFGSSTLFSTGAVAFNGADWKIHVLITRTAFSSQKAIVTFTSSSALLPVTVDYVTSSESLGSALALFVTGEATDNDDIVQQGAFYRWFETQ